MKTEFTKDYIAENKGCYSTEQVAALPFIQSKQEIVSLRNLFDGLPIKDFTWFLARKCELTNKQKVSLAVHCAEQVLPLYEKRYPTDMRVRECIQAVKDFEAGTITREVLLEKRAAADAAAAAAAYAAAAAAYADAAAYAAAAAAYADAAADAAAAAAYADAAADAAAAYADAAAAAAAAYAAYRESIWKFVEKLIEQESN